MEKELLVKNGFIRLVKLLNLLIEEKDKIKIIRLSRNFMEDCDYFIDSIYEKFNITDEDIDSFVAMEKDAEDVCKYMDNVREEIPEEEEKSEKTEGTDEEEDLNDPKPEK